MVTVSEGLSTIWFYNCVKGLCSNDYSNWATPSRVTRWTAFGNESSKSCRLSVSKHCLSPPPRLFSGSAELWFLVYCCFLIIALLLLLWSIVMIPYKTKGKCELIPIFLITGTKLLRKISHFYTVAIHCIKRIQFWHRSRTQPKCSALLEYRECII